jgi:hypothetical protein
MPSHAVGLSMPSQAVGLPRLFLVNPNDPNPHSDTNQAQDDKPVTLVVALAAQPSHGLPAADLLRTQSILGP